MAPPVCSASRHPPSRCLLQMFAVILHRLRVLEHSGELRSRAEERPSSDTTLVAAKTTFAVYGPLRHAHHLRSDPRPVRMRDKPLAVISMFTSSGTEQRHRKCDNSTESLASHTTTTIPRSHPSAIAKSARGLCPAFDLLASYMTVLCIEQELAPRAHAARFLRGSYLS